MRERERERERESQRHQETRQIERVYWANITHVKFNVPIKGRISLIRRSKPGILIILF